MPFKTLTKNLITSSSSSSSSSKRYPLLSHMRAVPTQKEIDIYIYDKLKNIKSDKKAIIMIGGPGSGKTSGIQIVLDMTKQKLDDFVIVSPDDVLEDFFNSDRTKYEDANKINNNLYETALNNNKNIIFDRTGTNFEVYYRTVISRIKDSGYNVVLCIVYNNYTNAKNRIEERTSKTGRAVNDSYARSSYRDLTFNIPNYIALKCQKVDEIFCFDNTSTSIDLIYKSKCINNNIVVTINNLI